MSFTYPKALDVNVCKSDMCRNLARVNASDYQSPTYHLGFPALHCNACGSNNYLLSNDDLNLIVLPKLATFYHRTKGTCPHCFHDQKILNGKTAKGTLRWKCKQCRQTFSVKQPYLNQISTLKQLADLLFNYADFKALTQQLNISDATFYRLLEQLALLMTDISQQNYQKKSTPAPLHVVTNTFRLHCKNLQSQKTSEQLWGMTSSDNLSGYILLNTVNYTQHPISPESVYHHQPQTATDAPESDQLSDDIKHRYHVFYQRSCFDQLVYTDADVSCKNGYLFQPVMAAHAHFLQLKHYYASPMYYHYLEHEVLIRGACITSFGDQVHEGNCHIFYLTESNMSGAPETWQLKARYYLGWWQNLWFEFTSETTSASRALAVLTNKHKLDESLLSQLPATFKQNNDFHAHWTRIFQAKRLATLQPETIQTLLTIFTTYFNYCVVDANQHTPAQNAGLAKRPFQPHELIDQFIKDNPLNC